MIRAVGAPQSAKGASFPSRSSGDRRQSTRLPGRQVAQQLAGLQRPSQQGAPGPAADRDPGPISLDQAVVLRIGNQKIGLEVEDRRCDDPRHAIGQPVKQRRTAGTDAMVGHGGGEHPGLVGRANHQPNRAVPRFRRQHRRIDRKQAGGITREDLRQRGRVPERGNRWWRRRSGLLQVGVAQSVQLVGDSSHSLDGRHRHCRLARSSHDRGKDPVSHHRGQCEHDPDGQDKGVAGAYRPERRDRAGGERDSCQDRERPAWWSARLRCRADPLDRPPARIAPTGIPTREPERALPATTRCGPARDD